LVHSHRSRQGTGVTKIFGAGPPTHRRQKSTSLTLTSNNSISVHTRTAQSVITAVYLCTFVPANEAGEVPRRFICGLLCATQLVPRGSLSPPYIVGVGASHSSPCCLGQSTSRGNIVQGVRVLHECHPY
jgi:hypothetical protein